MSDKIKIFYQYTVQDADNPDPDDMYHKKEFDDAYDAIEWKAQNSEVIRVNSIVEGNFYLSCQVKKH